MCTLQGMPRLQCAGQRVGQGSDQIERAGIEPVHAGEKAWQQTSCTAFRCARCGSTPTSASRPPAPAHGAAAAGRRTARRMGHREPGVITRKAGKQGGNGQGADGRPCRRGAALSGGARVVRQKEQLFLAELFLTHELAAKARMVTRNRGRQSIPSQGRGLARVAAAAAAARRRAAAAGGK